MKRLLLIAILFAAAMGANAQNRWDTIPGGIIDPYMGITYKKPWGNNITLPNRNIIFYPPAPTAIPRDSASSIVYISFSPADNGLGFRVDIDGGYMSMQYGNYKLPYGGYIKDHAKIAMGVAYKSYSLGLAYHRSGEAKVPEGMSLTKSTLRPISIEAGVRVFVTDWFAAAFRYDLFRHEGTVEFGIIFNKQ